MSETGSILNHTNEEDAAEKVSSSNNENSLIGDPSFAGTAGYGIEMLPEYIDKPEPVKMVKEANLDAENPSTERTSHCEIVTTPPSNVQTPPLRPGTPKNRINFVQRIMTESIKKSHKKVKD